MFIISDFKEEFDRLYEEVKSTTEEEKKEWQKKVLIAWEKEEIRRNDEVAKKRKEVQRRKELINYLKERAPEYYERLMKKVENDLEEEAIRKMEEKLYYRNRKR